MEELVIGPHPKVLEIAKDTDRTVAPKARGSLVVCGGEVRTCLAFRHPGPI